MLNSWAGTKRRLANDVERWVKESIISETQARAICTLHAVEYGNSNDNGAENRGARTLTVLAGLFAGIAIIIVVGANWEDIAREIRMGALVLTTLALHGLGIERHLHGKRGHAIGALITANMAFGASIALIAQIYAPR